MMREENRLATKASLHCHAAGCAHHTRKAEALKEAIRAMMPGTNLTPAIT